MARAMEQRNGEPEQPEGVGRRTVPGGGLGAGLGGATFAALPGSADGQTPTLPPPAGSMASFPASRSGPLNRPYNMVLFISDEEAYRLRAAEGYTTPARAELRRRGTTFLHHYIGSAMCTPSRGVIFSGQPPQVNGVFDQMEPGYVPSLPGPAQHGHVCRELGYGPPISASSSCAATSSSPRRRQLYRGAGGLRFRQLRSRTATRGSPDQGYHTDNYTVAEGNALAAHARPASTAKANRGSWS